MNFYVRLLLDVIDALFLCYALDCDGALGAADLDSENAQVHKLLGAHFGRGRTRDAPA
jgi:hypothetical protein